MSKYCSFCTQPCLSPCSRSNEWLIKLFRDSGEAKFTLWLKDYNDRQDTGTAKVIVNKTPRKR